MTEEDRRAAVLTAADAVCFADRQGGDVRIATAQLDSALLELRSALRRRRRFESRFELLPEIYSAALAAAQGLPYYWLLRETYALSTTGPMARVRGAVEQLTRRGVVVVVVNDRERRISIDRERRIPEREREAEILGMERERITAFSVAAAAC